MLVTRPGPPHRRKGDVQRYLWERDFEEVRHDSPRDLCSDGRTQPRDQGVGRAVPVGQIRGEERARLREVKTFKREYNSFMTVYDEMKGAAS